MTQNAVYLHGNLLWRKQGQRPFPPTHSHSAVIKTLLITAVFQNPTWVPHSNSLQKLHCTAVWRNTWKDKRDIKSSQRKLGHDKGLAEVRPRIWKNDFAVGQFGIYFYRRFILQDKDRRNELQCTNSVHFSYIQLHSTPANCHSFPSPSFACLIRSCGSCSRNGSSSLETPPWKMVFNCLSGKFHNTESWPNESRLSL
jgi:hypothetical protein